ncbi:MULTISPECIES: cold-shock protein [Pseudomonas]|uniref:cold-shock protein n=1 Tax=unclassified Pseudomonas TaxID=196821 RepID=UPI00031D7724|nr:MULTISPECIES: cold shock domain-containing protein [Pseudomonas]AYN93311.1 cold shock domain-containing protein [Pseudomonas sp. LTJR-52]MBW5412158.1 cold-shock protein [Pseudomonas sp. MAG002Y]MDN3236188.1 cold shock domain-containing protein [Pseudomonas sp. WAC2]
MSIRHQGTIKWFSEDKGFGFIIPQEGPDLFIHTKSFENRSFRGPNEGQLVSYQLIVGPKGFEAGQVRER